MRSKLKYLAVGLLCFALLIPCACVQSNPGPTSAPSQTPTVSPAPEATPPASTEPSIPLTPPPSSAPETPSDPSATGNIPALYPDVETELSYELHGTVSSVPAIRHHTLHGYIIVYDSAHYTCRTYHEVDSYWSDVGLYLSVSIVYASDLNYVLAGLRLQEDIEMHPQFTKIGSGDYPAYTLYTDANGCHRQFWTLNYAGDTMLIEQSYPLDHPEAERHCSIQLAMLDSLTLDNPPSPLPASGSVLNAYSGILKNLYYNHLFPDGSSADGDDLFGGISENRFAIFDIDRDGRDELILEYTATITAGQILQIYDYDENLYQLRLQFQTYPNVTFYDNGAIEARLSHNQGWGGAFWPYNLYVYDADTDSYTDVGWVDAWDKSVPASGYPEEIDTSNTGFVYYINSFDPVDYSVYRQWRDSYTGTAEELTIPYQFLTEENIAGIQ